MPEQNQIDEWLDNQTLQKLYKHEKEEAVRQAVKMWNESLPGYKQAQEFNKGMGLISDGELYGRFIS